MSAAKPLVLPRAFGKYELLEKIGSGGMAEAYRARLPGFGGFEKTLVIKRLHPHLAQSRKFADMFINEARIASRLTHPNVVSVYELGNLEHDELYIAMEYVPGTNLLVLLRQAWERKLELPLWFSLHVIDQLLSGLSAAHQLTDDEGEPLGVVHRDVTPSNIFLSFLGDVKLGDFGIASSRLRATETQPGEMRGKVGYMAPEQLLGKPLDARADLFAVGVILWEVITQRRLFAHNNPYEVMAAIVRGTRRRPSEYKPTTPAELDDIVVRALSKDAEGRFHSAQEFQNALDPIRASLAQNIRRTDVRDVVEVILGRRGAQSSTPLPALVSIEAKRSDAVSLPVGEIDVELSQDLDQDTALPLPRTRDLSHETHPEGVYEEQEKSEPLPIVVGSTVDLVPADEAAGDAEPAQDGPLVIQMGSPVDAIAAGIATPLIEDPNWVDGGYRGPYPLFLREEGRRLWGPCSWEQVASHLQRLHDQPRVETAIGLTPDSLVPLSVFAVLSGQESLRLDVPLPEGSRGSLRSRSLASILAALGNLKGTGRLLMIGESPVHPPLREIHVVEGQIVYVGTDAPGFQLPELFLRYGLIGPERIAELMYCVLLEQRSAEDLVAAALSTDVRQYFAHFHRERLAEMFSWRHGTYAFEAGYLGHRRDPIGPSTVAVILDAVLRSTAPEELDRALSGWNGRRLMAGERTAQSLRDVALTEGQQQGLRRVLSGTPVELALRQTQERRELASLLYVLGQAGLLRAA